ncbi:MAG TPA: bifunctional glycosyltransferase/class I SAM-dependent methyltransferase [Blastocatellia bacterium]|nr:bifunctional glycosyltransferase/class I SAM-dependent methyltransferase [Blastocatellia bacterium]
MEQNRVAIFIVAYNAERHIEKVLRRIPAWVAEGLAEIFIIDDHSADNTVEAAQKVDWPQIYAPLRIFRTPYNQGYGGNQRLGYLYAIEQGFDIVILLHGDGQYAPEALPYILAPYAEGTDAVFGSRFIRPRDAIKGGMPLYKWVGNRILTRMQNFILGSRMSEMHSGYRSYRTSALQQVPFTSNSLDFDFDADIIVQLHAAGLQITEVPIPTYYGDEICHVNGMRYAWQCVKTAMKYRLMQFEIFYDPKFDLRRPSQSIYTTKQAPTSLHHFMRNVSLESGSKLLDVGGGNGESVSRALAQRGVQVTCIDQYADREDRVVKQYTVDLDDSWERQFPAEQYDTVLALDVIEHLKSPEQGMAEIFRNLKRGGKLYASTGNVAYLPIRLALLAGWFNYGRRGILDLTHRRLFTVGSFRRLLKNAGFRIDRITNFGPPLRDLAVTDSGILKLADRMLTWLAKVWPTLFAYQILIECTRTDSPDDLMQRTFAETRKTYPSLEAAAEATKPVNHRSSMN